MKKHFKLLLILLPIVLFFACNDGNSENNEMAIPAPTALSYEVVKVYPHDTSAYTQGLEWNGNKLIEGTGLEGKSILQLLDTNMKTIGSKVRLSKEDFGEGTTLFKDKIYQLTWKTHKVFVYDAKNLQKIRELYWPYEGWGLTHNDTALIVSTGESNIYIVEPNKFSILKTIGVFNNYGYLSNINELEYVGGNLYANIYGRNEVVVIDMNTGQVKNNINFSNLLSQAGVKYDPLSIDAGYVLNGIAYHPKKNTYFITGKCWPVIVEVKLK